MYTVVLQSNTQSSHRTADILLDTLQLSSGQTSYSVIEYRGTEDRGCLYSSSKGSYEMIWVEAKVLRQDLLLLSSINLYPWDTTQSDMVWVEGDGNSQYSDTIFLSGLDKI